MRRVAQLGLGLSALTAIVALPTICRAEVAALDLPGLVLHLDADDDSVVKDGSGYVSRWNDITGTYNTLANDVRQDNSAYQPLWVASGIGGLAAIQFGSNDRLENYLDGALVPSGSARTMFLVADTGATGVGGNLITYQGAAAPRYLTNLKYYQPDGNVYLYTDSVVQNFYVPAGSGASAVLSTIRNPFVAQYASGAGSSFAVDVNGTSVFSTTDAIANTENAPTGFTVGEAYSGSEAWDGMIAELLVYNRQLTPAEMNQVGYYLATKYEVATDYTEPVPEPATTALLVTGLLGLLGCLRRKRS